MSESVFRIVDDEDAELKVYGPFSDGSILMAITANGVTLEASVDLSSTVELAGTLLCGYKRAHASGVLA